MVHAIHANLYFLTVRFVIQQFVLLAKMDISLIVELVRFVEAGFSTASYAIPFIAHFA
jgi:hypothetical protein